MKTVYVCFNTDQGWLDIVTDNIGDMLVHLDEMYVCNADDYSCDSDLTKDTYYDPDNFDKVKEYVEENWNLNITKTEINKSLK